MNIIILLPHRHASVEQGLKYSLLDALATTESIWAFHLRHLHLDDVYKLAIDRCKEFMVISFVSQSKNGIFNARTNMHILMNAWFYLVYIRLFLILDCLIYPNSI